jgi:CheY-like chemotaxis protein
MIKLLFLQVIKKKSYLRLSVPTQKIVPQSPLPTGEQMLQTNRKFILIGEDDIDDQEFLKEIFSSIDNSFELLFVNNGTRVLSQLENLEDKHLPCLILLDYNMPELNGAEILKKLKTNSRYNGIPRIIWSTSRSETYKNICLTLGATDYVVKPSNVNDLTQAVRYMLSFCTV